MSRPQPVSLHHVRGLTKGDALGLTRTLHDYGLQGVARGYRSNGGDGPPGGWRWSVCYLDAPWLVSLICACTDEAHRSTPATELRSALAAIKLVTDGDWAIPDTLHRLGGAQAIVAFVCKACPGSGNSLSFIWSRRDAPAP